MAQRRSLTSPEHGREHLAFSRERNVADRIHAVRHPIQPALFDAARDRVTIESGRQQLRERHQPVLTPRKRRNHAVRRGGWPMKVSPRAI
jgi:hypothetical protein